MVDRMFFSSVFMLFGAVMLLWICFSHFHDDIVFYNKQAPAVCVDGRKVDDQLSAARFAVDDALVHRDIVDMRCAVPTSVYACANKRAESIQQCQPLDAEQPIWPAHTIDPELKCVSPGALNIGARNFCKDKVWTCSIGPCDAYEKARRLCANLMNPASYFCYYAPGQEALGIKEEKVRFPTPWLAGGTLLGMAIALGSLAALFWVCQQQDTMAAIATVGSIFFTSFVCLGIVTLTVYLLSRLSRRDVEDSHGMGTAYLTLAAAMASSNPSNFSIVPEEPVLDREEWWHHLDWVYVGSTFLVVGLVMSFLSCYACVCGSKSKDGNTYTAMMLHGEMLQGEPTDVSRMDTEFTESAWTRSEFTGVTESTL